MFDTARLIREVDTLRRELDSVTLIRPLPPFQHRLDGVHILGVCQEKWGREPRWRIIHWNNGIGKCAYTSPCWMCSVSTISIPEDSLVGWLPLPIGPWHTSRNEGDFEPLLAVTPDAAGRRIRQAREGRALGLRAAARELGISPTTLSRMERGEDGYASRFFAALAWAEDSGRSALEAE